MHGCRASWEGHAPVRTEGPGPGRWPDSVPAAHPKAVHALAPTGGSRLLDGPLHLRDRKSHALAELKGTIVQTRLAQRGAQAPAAHPAVGATRVWHERAPPRLQGTALGLLPLLHGQLSSATSPSEAASLGPQPAPAWPPHAPAQRAAICAPDSLVHARTLPGRAECVSGTTPRPQCDTVLASGRTTPPAPGPCPALVRRAVPSPGCRLRSPVVLRQADVGGGPRLPAPLELTSPCGTAQGARPRVGRGAAPAWPGEARDPAGCARPGPVRLQTPPAATLHVA